MYSHWPHSFAIAYYAINALYVVRSLCNNLLEHLDHHLASFVNVQLKLILIESEGKLFIEITGFFLSEIIDDKGGKLCIMTKLLTCAYTHLDENTHISILSVQIK